MSELDVLRTEVEALRREVRSQRRIHRVAGLAVLAVAGIAAMTGAKEAPSVLKADRIEVGEIGDGDAEKRPAIVLEQGATGPSITLRTDDDRTTRLTMAGLEVTTSMVPARSMPTLGASGLGTVDPPPEKPKDGESLLKVDVGRELYVSHLEVVCANGFRKRALFAEGLAVLAMPNDLSECRAVFGGGLTAVRVNVHAGDDLVCRYLAPGSALTCTQRRLWPGE